MSTSGNFYSIRLKINTNELELTFQDGEENLYEKLSSKYIFYRFCQSQNLTWCSRLNKCAIIAAKHFKEIIHTLINNNMNYLI